MTTDNLWLPREDLMAEETRLSEPGIAALLEVDVALLEVDVGESFLFLWRLYCTKAGNPLLGQEELPRRELGYARSLRLERNLCSERV